MTSRLAGDAWIVFFPLSATLLCLQPDVCLLIIIICCLFLERLLWRMVLQSSTDLGRRPFLLRHSLSRGSRIQKCENHSLQWYLFTNCRRTILRQNSKEFWWFIPLILLCTCHFSCNSEPIKTNTWLLKYSCLVIDD